MAAQTKQSAALASPGYLVPFMIVAALFFIFGFITNLNMGLVPYLRNIFEVQGLLVWQAMLANGAFFTAYFVCSSPTAKLIEIIGYKRTIVVSLFIQVLGALLFCPPPRWFRFPCFCWRSSWWGQALLRCRLRQILTSPFLDLRTALRFA